MVTADLVAQQLINGLFFGGQLALLSVGLTLIWGVARVLNFAHGGIFMIGAYLGLYTIGATESWLAAIAVAVLGTFLVGVAIESALVSRLRDRREFDFAAIIVTLGLWIVLEQSMRLIAGSTQRSVEPISTDVWIPDTEFVTVVISVQRLLIFAISIVAIGLLFVVIRYTKFGLSLRAAAESDDVTQLMGVDLNRVYALTFGLSAALAGLAGVLLAPIFSVYPAVGNRPFLLAFIVVMIGGLGSVRGTLLAALLLALVRSLSTIWVSVQGATILLFVFMIAVLVATPEGFGGWIES